MRQVLHLIAQERNVELSSTSSSVWPGYVAAVSSLVLSLLLLAGVLVVSISQASRIVDAYNNKLITSVILDQQREPELERLRRESPALYPESDKSKSTQAQRPVPAASAGSASAQTERSVLTAADIERTLVAKNNEFLNAQNELARLRAEARNTVPPTEQTDALKKYRLVFAADAEGLDSTMLAQLRQHLLRDGAPSPLDRWQLEAGTKGMDPVAEREIYRLMLAIRLQLQPIGISTDHIKVVIQREQLPLTPQVANAVKPNGEMVMTLRREFQKAGK